LKIETLHAHFLKSSGICTDSRKISKDCLFIALRGENFNGNEYAREALDKGAYKAVIDDLSVHTNTGETILSDDSLALLQKLATFHRRYLDIPVIALTGSNGKTTTKELINAVLSQKFKTTATRGNLNNHIGVPLTLLSMNKETEIGIVEMGANHQKEIELLSNIAQPDYGLITNFGKAHLEGFGGVEGVIKGKSELYTHIIEHGKMVFVNGNDPKQMELTKLIDRFTFGSGDFDCTVQLKDAPNYLQIAYNGLNIQTNLIGNYNFHNIAAAIAIGEFFKVPADLIKKAIESYTPQNNRSQVIEKAGFRIIMDAYNANPTSMMAAVETFLHTQGENKIMILGDMFELGESAGMEHQKITDFLELNPFGKAFLIGSNFYNTSRSKDYIHMFETFDDFRKEWQNLKIQSATLLVKGSRGMALERVLELV
jgi:UDP-N-acetylmuramoyl-tripeptide--D-alanyl-D-alanine ligase